jgi:LPXTG-motif cell wall-anchored protein
MRRTSTAVMVLLIFTSFFIMVDVDFDIFSINCRGDSLYVGGVGPGNYTKIQDAINDAKQGDEIFVHEGTYNEDLFINKTLTLTGENKKTTMVDVTGHTFGISIKNAEYVNMSGFTVKGANSCNLKLENSNHSHIYDSIFRDAEFCALQIYPGNENLIEDNLIIDNLHGVLISGSSHGNVLDENTIKGTSQNAIIVQSHADDNLLINNNITEYTIGIYIKECEDIQIKDNLISNGDEGMSILDLSTVLLSGNIISNNDVAVKVWDFAEANIINCTLESSSSNDIMCGDLGYGNAEVTLINTTFDSEKVYFDDSHSKVTVHWFLHVKVIGEAETPVPEITVRVRNSKLDLDENFTTNSEGYVRWISLPSYQENQTSKVNYSSYNITAHNATAIGYASPEVTVEKSKEITIKVYSDTDGDGYLDINDDFPNEPTQWKDTDDDGYGDNATGNNPDAFPSDPAASRDSDGDGYPNEWNPGKSEGDSTTGLKLDAYPNDRSKWKKEEEEDNSFIFLTVGLVMIIIAIILIVKKKKKTGK